MQFVLDGLRRSVRAVRADRIHARAGFLPFAAIEDTGAGVTWAAQIAWPGSWEMEAYRRDDFVQLSGGLADRELRALEQGSRSRRIVHHSRRDLSPLSTVRWTKPVSGSPQFTVSAHLRPRTNYRSSSTNGARPGVTRITIM